LITAAIEMAARNLDLFRAGSANDAMGERAWMHTIALGSFSAFLVIDTQERSGKEPR
jgi:hypothetical protein